MKGPLSSLKVLDFSTLLPGPFASLLLADMGADVAAWSRPGAWTWCGAAAAHRWHLGQPCLP